MNKTEALLRVAEIQSSLRELTDEAAALRKIIEAPEPVEKKPLLYGHGGLIDYTGHAQNRRVADAHAEAFNTLPDLRRQPGSEPAEDGTRQWFIDADGDATSWATHQKTALICPPFDSEASALAAKEAVGWDRILRMYNTLHGRGY